MRAPKHSNMHAKGERTGGHGNKQIKEEPNLQKEKLVCVPKSIAKCVRSD